MMRHLRLLGGLLLASALVACGGGGGSAGTVPNAPAPVTPEPPSVSSTVADFAVSTSKATINNSGTDQALLTVTAVDANRNVVSGAVVSVAVDANAVFVPISSGGTSTTTGTGTSTVSGNVTGANGAFTGNIGIGADKTDRNVTATVMVNNITKKVSVRVSGTKLTLQAVPSSPSPGQNVLLTATVLDFAGNAIPNIPVSVGGNIGFGTRTVTTSLTGVATTTFAAPTASGVYTITGAANGVMAADYQVQVFSSAVPSAVIPVGAQPSLSASPNVLAVNAPGSTTNRSTLRFLFLDAANRPISNVRVRFEDMTSGLPSVGASISTAATTLYTDTSGSVSAQYISGQNSSPTNGVTVRACYAATDAGLVGCPTFVTASLTVAGQALAISIGDDNLLEKGSGTYIKRFAVTVADSAGRAVSGAPVDISVDLTHYGKGLYGNPYGDGSALTNLAAVPSSLTASFPSDSVTPATSVPDPSSTATVSVGRVWCANEDTNRNGNVDPGENKDGSVDSNGQPTLEPRKSDLLVSYNDPAVTTTNASGILVIKVEYSQRFATWLAYKVRITANVAGSQGMAERLFVTDLLRDDALNGSFFEPPYGTRSCRTPN